MRITARPIGGKPGCVEILVDGKKCEEIRCKSGTARVSGSGRSFESSVRMSTGMKK